MVLTMAYKYLRGVAGPTGFSSKSTAEEIVQKNIGRVKGKVFIVTGCNTGIGKETVRALAAGGGQVVMACRDGGRMKDAAEDVLKAHPEAKITQLELDLTAFESIRKFVKNFEALRLPLHGLINNAAVMACAASTTQDGIEMQFGTNVVGHFLLTTLLLPILKATGTKDFPTRVVNVSSSAHQFASKGCFQDLSLGNYSAWGAYGRSKLGNIFFTRELSRRLQAEGANVRTYSLHPGCIITDLQRSSPASRILMGVAGPLRLWKTVPQGAATQTAVAVLDDKLLVDGEYYADCNTWPTTPRGQDVEEAAKVWAQLESLVENPRQTSFP